MNKYCRYCKKLLRIQNKSGICSNCYRNSIWKKKYEELKENTDRRLKLYDITIKDLMNKLELMKLNKIREEERIYDNNDATF